MTAELVTAIAGVVVTLPLAVAQYRWFARMERGTK